MIGEKGEEKQGVNQYPNTPYLPTDGVKHGENVAISDVLTLNKDVH